MYAVSMWDMLHAIVRKKGVLHVKRKNHFLDVVFVSR